MSCAAILAGTTGAWAAAALLCGVAMLAGCLALRRASGQAAHASGTATATATGEDGGVAVPPAAPPSPFTHAPDDEPTAPAAPAARRARAADATAGMARQASGADEAWVFASATPFAALRLAGHCGGDGDVGAFGGAARRAAVAAIGQGLPVVFPRSSQVPGRGVGGSLIAVPLFLDHGLGAVVVAVCAGLRRTDHAVIEDLLRVAEQVAVRRAQGVHRLRDDDRRPAFSVVDLSAQRRITVI